MNADSVNPDVQRGYDRVAYGFTKDDLESLGEREVRNRFNNGGYGHPNTPPFVFVSGWLSDKEFARLEEERAVAKEANRIASASSDSARLQSQWAIWAAIIATIAIVIAMKDQIVALVISWLP